MEKTIKIDTIEKYARIFGCPGPVHPLFHICRLEKVKDFKPIENPVALNLYTMSIKDGTTCTAQYGWRNYDFSKGTLNFFAPNQIHRWNTPAPNGGRWGWMLAFHPDFIKRYPLGEKIGQLKFFDYETCEALHISDKEREVLENMLMTIEDEANQRIDNHTQDIIVSQLDVFFNYAQRFYERQFRTRQSVEGDVVAKVHRVISGLIADNIGELPTPAKVASCMGMSTAYLSDQLKALSGMTAQQHIHRQIVEKSKTMLLSTGLSISEIAYALGFEYPQYFSRLFKTKTGMTPIQFREQYN